MAKTEKILIGNVGVDSGNVAIVDPCYVIGNKDYDYDRFCEERNNENTQDIVFSGMAGNGIVSSSGFGDGSYPVYAEISDEGEWGKRVKSLTIKFF